MALTITGRPEKTLDNGYISKWNASATPLQYKFTNDRFPTNSVDGVKTSTGYSYDSSQRGTVIPVSTVLGLAIDQWVKVDFPSLSGIFKVQNVNGVGLTITVNTFVPQAVTEAGTVQIYYKGYKGLVRVYGGAPEYHPYNIDGSKPQTLIGTTTIFFDENNEGNINIRNFVKPDMLAQYSDLENNPNLWSSFAIEYAEVWEGLDENSVTYEEDIIDGCLPFVGFSNANFNSGLTDWSAVPQEVPWVAGVGSITATSSGGSDNFIDTLYQSVELKNSIPYTVEIDYNWLSGREADNFIFRIQARDKADNTFKDLKWFNGLSLGAGAISTEVTPTFEADALGVQCYVENPVATAFSLQLDRFEVTSIVAEQCKYSSFAILGAKQFQDPIGGNFGDYIASFQTEGKFLTHFNELRYPFLFSSIIPNATFNRASEISLRLNLFDETGANVEATDQEIINKSDGVYIIDPVINSTPCQWKTGTAQIISKPNNLLLDGDGGTYEDATPVNWNITQLSYSVGTPDQIGGTIVAQSINYDSVNYQVGGFNTSSPELIKSNEPYSIAVFDTEIQVQQGQEYIIESDIFAFAIDFEPNQVNNTKSFLGLDGYDISELTSYTTFECPAVENKGKLTTSFIAKGSSVKIKLMQLTDTSINNSTGGVWYLDNTTFKGPIENLTEVKTLNSSCGTCQENYELQMRWLNDLGGWDRWNFSQAKTLSTNITNKVDIRRDVTLDWDNTFINGDTEYDAIKIEAQPTVLVRSQNITKDEAIALSKIRTSIKPQAYINNKWVTVSIDGGSFVVLEEDSKVREMSFSMKLPNTIIQEQ